MHHALAVQPLVSKRLLLQLAAAAAGQVLSQ
jgi:hypothetical protein